MVGGAVDDRLGENTMSEFAGRYQRLSVRTPGSCMSSTPGCRSLSPSWRSLRVGRCTTPLAASGWTPSAGARRPLGVGPGCVSWCCAPGWARAAAVVGDPGFELANRVRTLIDHRFIDPPVRVPGNRYLPIAMEGRPPARWPCPGLGIDLRSAWPLPARGPCDTARSPTSATRSTRKSRPRPRSRLGW
jgi:hypothetical protein